MAYEIISQNNNTTTLSDGTNTITVPGYVNLATSTSYTISEVNNNTATLEGSDGSVIRDVPCVVVLAGEGGGGGSSLPDQTGHSGEFLTTDGTDASWAAVNALQNTATGTDSIATGTATAAGNQSTAFGESAEASTQDSTAYGYDATAKTNIGATAVGASSQAVGQWSSAYGFEAQARNTTCIQLGSGTNTTSGTFKVGFKNNGNYELLNNQGFIPTARFTTDPVSDGTYVPTLTITSGVATRSWSAPSGGLPSQTGNAGKFLTTDGTDASWSDKPLVNTATGNYSLTILGTASTRTSSVNIGSYSITSGDRTVTIGRSANTTGVRSVAIGYASQSAAYGIAIGDSADAAASSILLNVSGVTRNNMTPNTFEIANSNGKFCMMSADGTIPTARLTKVNTTVTLAAADWNGGTTVTKTVSGITTTGVVLVSPDPTDQSAYTSAGIICTTQAADSLTFTCSTTPSADIDVNVVML